jgi:hypothetical protein
MLWEFWALYMAACGMYAKPFTPPDCEPGGPTGWPMFGPIRRMSLRDDGREPIWGCGVWPRGPKTPLEIGGDADGVWCRMTGNGGCDWN